MCGRIKIGNEEIIKEALKQTEEELKNETNCMKEKWVDITIKKLKEVMKEYENGLDEIVKQIYSFYEKSQKEQIVNKEFIDGVLAGEMGGEYEDEISEMFQERASELASQLEKKYDLSEIEHEDDWIRISKFQGLFCVYLDSYGNIEIEWIYEDKFESAIKKALELKDEQPTN